MSAGLRLRSSSGGSTIEIRIQRVYDRSPRPGAAVLVDRVWPRGVPKDELQRRGVRWLREVAPSDELRRWFGHRPERWPEFRERYRAELDQEERRAAVSELVAIARREPLTLLFSARDVERNQATVLAEVIAERL